MPRIKIVFNPFGRHGNTLTYADKTPRKSIQRLVRESIRMKFITAQDLEKWSKVYSNKSWLDRFKI